MEASVEYSARLRRSKRTSPLIEFLRAFSKSAGLTVASDLVWTTGRLIMDGRTSLSQTYQFRFGIIGNLPLALKFLQACLQLQPGEFHKRFGNTLVNLHEQIFQTARAGSQGSQKLLLAL